MVGNRQRPRGVTGRTLIALLLAWHVSGPVRAQAPERPAVGDPYSDRIDAVIAQAVRDPGPYSRQPDRATVLADAPAPAQAAGSGLGAGSPTFPEGISYSVEFERNIQRISNPYRLLNSAGSQRRSDTAVADELRTAFVVPLASERTRLLASAAFGNVAYQDQSKLDYHPHALRAALQWRAGDLLRGSLTASDRVRQNRFLSTSWPERDLIKQRLFSADVGLWVTESLALPRLSVSRSRSRYEFAANRALYNRDDSQFQVAASYLGKESSYVMAGMSMIRSHYPDRTALQVQQLDEAYRDREYFVSALWDYSAKTQVETYLGWRHRSYANLAARDVNFLTADLKGNWLYSAKTSFHLHLWSHPYGNEEDPAILYSIQSGGRFSVRWKAGEKTWLSMNVVRERQKNYLIGSGGMSETMAWRFGPRLEWQVHRNVLLTLDGWREQISGAGYPGYGGTVVRIGVVLSHDNDGSPPASRQYVHVECDAPRYVETSYTCDP